MFNRLNPQVKGRSDEKLIRCVFSYIQPVVSMGRWHNPSTGSKTCMFSLGKSIN
uniref:Uncharacterized protein n=1 Tax=Picea sitchensis TaxID=3332 RepID=A0A6B9XYD2_PICSI|nr:hypothetical protein Q903MT_gene5662 [Picea sitchensis]